MLITWENRQGCMHIKARLPFRSCKPSLGQLSASDYQLTKSMTLFSLLCVNV